MISKEIIYKNNLIILNDFGFYEIYLDNRFLKFDCLNDVKNKIKEVLK